jgi:predicted ABC-type ATPase
VCVLAGPNGAGKTTVSRALVRDELAIHTFVNADAIAQGLSGFSPDAAAVAAGRLMLQRIRALAATDVDFAFETTLASRSLAPRLMRLRRNGRELLLVFVWLPSPELAIERVRGRAASGGHDVPIATIRRRFARGIENFHRLYRPLVDRWWRYDNGLAQARLAARGEGATVEVLLPATWQQVCS